MTALNQEKDPSPESQFYGTNASNFVTPSPRLGQGLGVSYLESSNLEDFLRINPEHIVALVNYGGNSDTSSTNIHLSISIGMQQLIDPHLIEVWTSPSPISSYENNFVRAVFNEEMLFGYVQLDERDGQTLDELAYSAYRDILKDSFTLGYPHILRMWNYFPDINLEQRGLERYRWFCIGRHKAFSEHHGEYKSTLPAATAIGTQSGPLHVYFLAGKNPATYIENPRQINAYDYPAIYGPKSPSFSRATFGASQLAWHLFLAGTASIVGHATQHQGDVLGQALETISNLNALINHARQQQREIIGPNENLSSLKVYIRHSQDLELIRETLESQLKIRGMPVLYLEGDICRSDLILEIEGILTSV